MSLREGLTTALTTGLGTGYKVIGYPAALDAVTGPTVSLWATNLEHLPAAPNGHYQVTYTVQLFTGHQDPARADDALDASLEDLLGVLWNLDDYLLERAERTVSEDNRIHSWTLTLTGGIKITEA